MKIGGVLRGGLIATVISTSLALGPAAQSAVAAPIAAPATKTAPVQESLSSPIQTQVSGGSAPGASRSGFEPLVPARLADTRPGTSTTDGIGAATGWVESRSSLDVEVAGRGGVPSTGAVAAVLNITVVDATANGYLTAYPAGIAPPNASNINFLAGRNVANQAIVALGANGGISLYTSARTHLIVDVVGWVNDESSAGVMTPARFADTRPGTATIDGRFVGVGSIGADRTFEVRVADRAGLPATGVGAVVLNIAAVDPRGGGYLTVYPSTHGRPNASSVNFGPGETTANQVVTGVGDAGTIAIYTSAETHLIVDIVGWLPVGTDLKTQNPARLVDTRPGTSTADGQQQGTGAVAAGTEFRINAAGRSTVPANGFGSVVLNVTVTQPQSAGYLTIYPAGDERPNASSLNFVAGQTVANQVIAKVGERGDVIVYTSAATQLIIDVAAWLPPGLNAPDPRLVQITGLNQPLAPLSGGPGTGSARFEAPTANPPKIDDLIALMTPSGKPYYGVVTGGGVGYIDTKEVGLNQILPNMKMSLSGDPTSGELIDSNANGAPITSFQVAGSTPNFSGGLEIESKKVPCTGSGTADIDVQPNLDLTNWVFDVDWGLGLNSARIGYNPRFSIMSDIELTAGTKCKIGVELFEKDLPTIRFSIFAIPIVIESTLGAELEFSASATGTVFLKAGFEAEAFIGIVYDSDGWRLAREARFTRTWRTQAKVDISIGASLPISLSMTANGIANLTLTLEPGVTATLSPLSDRWLAIEAEVKASATVGIKLDFKLFTFSASVDLGEITLWGPKTIYERRKSTDLNIEVLTAPDQIVEARSYLATMKVTGGQDSSTWSWSAENLPAGLEIVGDGRNARIQGSPTQSGDFQIVVTATEVPEDEDDAVHDPATDVIDLRVIPPVTVITTSLPEAELTAPYQKVVAAINGKGPYTWTVTGLPDGITFTRNPGSAVGVLSGTPTTAGTAQIRFQVDDSAGSPQADKTLDLIVNERVTTDNPTIPGGSLGVPYTVSFNASQGVGPYRWNASGIPPGLTVATSGAKRQTLTISGTPTTSNPFTLRVNTIDSYNISTTPVGGTGIIYPQLQLRTTSVALPLGSTPWLPTDGRLEISGGKAPYTWTITGLPDGVTFDATQSGLVARLAGASTTRSNVTARIRVVDSAGSPPIDQDLPISTSDLLRFTTLSLPDGAVGAPYSATITLTGDGTPTNWRVLNLPAGLTLSGSNSDKVRTLSGTPTRTGAYNLIIYVTDDGGRERGASYNLGFAPALTFSTTNINGALLTVPYAQDLQVTGGLAPYTWTVTGLPSGLALNTANPTAALRTIEGTATVAGANSVTISVTDAANSPAVGGTFSLPVAQNLAISTTGIVSTNVYTVAPAYSGIVSSSGGHAPVTFSQTGLPAGMTFDTGTGAVGGIPTSTGTSNVTFTARDAYGYTRSASVTINSVNPPSVSVASASTSAPTGSFYSAQPTVTGGVPNFTWTATGLPTWASINPTTGRISGTPSDGHAGTSSTINVTATDANSRSSSASYTLMTVLTPPLTLSVSSVPTTAQAGVAYVGNPAVSGGTGPYTVSISGQPAWMSVDQITGRLSGTPLETQGGSATVTVNVIDTATPPRSASSTFTVVTSTTPLTVSLASVPTNATAGTAYTGTATVTTTAGITLPYVWSLTNAPTWLSINSSGVLSGTPAGTDGGTRTITVNVSDGTNRTGSASYTLDVKALTLDTSGVKGASVSIAYAGQLAQTNGRAPVVYTATNLPAWATLNPNTGVITGTPAESDNETNPSVTFTVTDADNVTASATVSIPVRTGVLVLPGPGTTFIHNRALSQWGRPVAGVYYGAYCCGYTINVTGLPTGLTASLSTDGMNDVIVKGTPTVLGDFSVTVTATDTQGRVGTATFTLSVVTTAPALVFDDSNMVEIMKTNPGNLPVWYPFGRPQATGGVPPYRFTIDPTSIPVGVRDMGGGELWPDFGYAGFSGLPFPSGNYTLRWTVTDHEGTQSTGTSRLVFYPADVAMDITALATQLNKDDPYVSAIPTVTGGALPPVNTTATYTWTATGLPTGLSIASATGQITGTPTVAGNYTVTITATDYTGLVTDTETWTVTVIAPLVIDTTGFATQVDERGYYSQQLDSTVTWTVTGLPKGLAYDSTTKKISGRPYDGPYLATVAGTYTVQLAGTKPGQSGTASFTIEVTARPDVTMLSTGIDYSCARYGDGRVKCWGNTDGGRLGHLWPTTVPATSGPVAVTDASGTEFTNFTQVFSSNSIWAGSQYSCGITDTRAVYCWGTSGGAVFGANTTTGAAILSSNTAREVRTVVRADNGTYSSASIQADTLALTSVFMCASEVVVWSRPYAYRGWCFGTNDSVGADGTRKSWTALGSPSGWGTLASTDYVRIRQLTIDDNGNACTLRHKWTSSSSSEPTDGTYAIICQGLGTTSGWHAPYAVAATRTATEDGLTDNGPSKWRIAAGGTTSCTAAGESFTQSDWTRSYNSSGERVLAPTQAYAETSIQCVDDESEYADSGTPEYAALANESGEYGYPHGASVTRNRVQKTNTPYTSVGTDLLALDLASKQYLLEPAAMVAHDGGGCAITNAAMADPPYNYVPATETNAGLWCWGAWFGRDGGYARRIALPKRPGTGQPIVPVQVVISTGYVLVLDSDGLVWSMGGTSTLRGGDPTANDVLGTANL